MFVLPVGEYDDDFIKGLAAAVRMKLIEADALDSMFKDKLSHPEIARRVLRVVKTNLKKRKQ